MPRQVPQPIADELSLLVDMLYRRANCESCKDEMLITQPVRHVRWRGGPWA